MVTPPAHQPLSQPQFIIQSGGVYYLTLSVWAYDPDAEGLTAGQIEAAQAIQEQFESLKATGALVAVEVRETRMYMAVISGSR